jgi:hypothetical protein
VGRKAVVVDLKSALFANDGAPSPRIWVDVTKMEAHSLTIDKITAKWAFYGHSPIPNVCLHRHHPRKLINGIKLGLLNPF